MKKSNKAKILLALVSVMVVIGIVAGGTLMFLQDKTDPLVNKFEATQVTCEINEEFDGQSKKNVTVTNTGSIDAYIRAAIIINWVNDDGEILGTPVKSADYIITGKSDKWVKASDGYYYYTDRVAAGAPTENLIGECKLASGVTAPEGYYLSVTIVADAIQADPASAKTAAGWAK